MAARAGLAVSTGVDGVLSEVAARMERDGAQQSLVAVFALAGAVAGLAVACIQASRISVPLYEIVSVVVLPKATRRGEHSLVKVRLEPTVSTREVAMPTVSRLLAIGAMALQTKLHLWQTHRVRAQAVAARTLLLAALVQAMGEVEAGFWALDGAGKHLEFFVDWALLVHWALGLFPRLVSFPCVGRRGLALPLLMTALTVLHARA
jgi:hypothetical protein